MAQRRSETPNPVAAGAAPPACRDCVEERWRAAVPCWCFSGDARCVVRQTGQKSLCARLLTRWAKHPQRTCCERNASHHGQSRARSFLDGQADRFQPLLGLVKSITRRLCCRVDGRSCTFWYPLGDGWMRVGLVAVWVALVCTMVLSWFKPASTRSAVSGPPQRAEHEPHDGC